MENWLTAGESRRHFILRSGALLGAAVCLGPALALAADTTDQETAEVTPTEDLMQEHGVLRRLLLLYDAACSRLSQGGEVPLAVLQEATGIIRRFVEDYHEKDEEEYLFARFEKAGKQTELVKVLYQQHRAGRKLTTALQGLLSPGPVGQVNGSSAGCGLPARLCPHVPPPRSPGRDGPLIRLPGAPLP